MGRLIDWIPKLFRQHLANKYSLHILVNPNLVSLPPTTYTLLLYPVGPFPRMTTKSLYIPLTVIRQGTLCPNFRLAGHDHRGRIVTRSQDIAAMSGKSFQRPSQTDRR